MSRGKKAQRTFQPWSERRIRARDLEWVIRGDWPHMWGYTEGRLSRLGEEVVSGTDWVCRELRTYPGGLWKPD